MLYTPLPETSEAFEQLAWTDIEPWYAELNATILSSETLIPWLTQWSRLCELADEVMILLEIATTQDTTNQESIERQERFLKEIYPHTQINDQQLKQQLLNSGLTPDGFTIPLRSLRAESQLFREENVPLLAEEQTISRGHSEITGSQMVEWEGRNISVIALFPELQSPQRERREHAWKTIAQRRLADREQLTTLWQKGIQTRQQIAKNANYKNYRDYRWKQLFRFDYTPDDCKTFHQAVEQVVVPILQQIWEKRRKLLGVETIRPWDIDVNPYAQDNPRTFSDIHSLLQQCIQLFQRIHPQLGGYYATMVQEQLLDLEHGRPGKANVGYMLALEAQHKPFTFGHAKTLEDVASLICHEAGHAFHVYAMGHLPYYQQRREGFLSIEVGELASTSMELIGPMHFAETGICTEEEEVQLRITKLESLLSLIVVTTIGDAFQHWVYENPQDAQDQEQCDQKWIELKNRFQPYIDWSGLEAEQRSGWQNPWHFYGSPFYYIEYAFAALGALQVLEQYIQNPQTSLQKYLEALSLGATVSVPDGYAAAGAKFAFDITTLKSIMNLATQITTDLEEKVKNYPNK